GLFAIDIVLPWIDMNEGLAPFHELIVGDVKGNHGAGNLRRDADRPAIGIGVVGAFEVAGRKPVVDAAREQKADNGEADHRDEGASLFSPRLAGVVVLRLLRNGAVLSFFP